MPALNAALWIRQALDSVVGQTYSELEIILIDDGSTDATTDIIAEYAARDARVRAVYHSSTWGRGASRNEGLTLATGEWVSFVDADDWQALDRYARMLACAAGADLVFCNVANYFGPHRPLSPVFHFPAVLSRDYCFRSLGTLCSRLVRTALIREHGLRFPDVRETGIQFEDVYFHYLGVAHAQQIAFVDECLYTHRRHPASVTGIFSENPELHFDCFRTWDELARVAPPGLLCHYLHVFRHYLPQVDSSYVFYRRVKAVLAESGLRREDVPAHLRGDFDFFRRFPWWTVLRAKLFAVKLGPQQGRVRLVFLGRKVLDYSFGPKT